MGEFLDNLPWPKIGAAVGAAVLTIGGGGWYKGVKDGQVETANAPASLQQEHISRHWNWAEDCRVILEDVTYGTQTRYCPGDDCLLYVRHQSGISSHVFQPSLAEVTLPPRIMGEAPDPWSGAAYAQSCLTLEQHGPPNHPETPYTSGEDLGNGWVWLYGNWIDGCRYRWQFHPASRSQGAGEWFTCVH